MYLAGFFDGEGTVTVSSRSLQCLIGNTDENIINIIQEKYGGKLYLPKKNKCFHRQFYNLSFRKEESVKLIQDIYPYTIIKKQRIELALKYIISDNKPEKEFIYFKMKQLNKRGKCEEVKNINIDYISEQYMAGLFDAEGSFSIRKLDKDIFYKSRNKTYHILSYFARARISLCDDFCFDYLKQKYKGTTTIRHNAKPNHSDSITWCVVGNDCASFIKEIHKYLIIKKQHANIILELQATRSKRYNQYTMTQEIKDKHEKLYKEIRQLNSHHLEIEVG